MERMEMEVPGADSLFQFLEEHIHDLEIPQLEEASAGTLGDYLDIITPMVTPEPREESMIQDSQEVSSSQMQENDSVESIHTLYEAITPVTVDPEQQDPDQEQKTHESVSMEQEPLREQEQHENAPAPEEEHEPVEKAGEDYWATNDGQDEPQEPVEVPPVDPMWGAKRQLAQSKVYWSSTEASNASTIMEMPEEEDSMKTQLGKMATELRELRTWIGTFEDSRKGLQATLATVMDRHHWDRHNLAVARAKTQEMEVSHSMMIFNLSLAESSTQLYKTQLAEAKQVIEKLRTELKVTQEHNLSLRDNVYVLENLMNDHTPDRTPF